MKTRIIKTDIFTDEVMLQLETQSRMIAIYLYCNKHIGLTPIYKLPIGYVQLETGYDESSIRLSLDKLQEVGIIQHMNYYWINLCRLDFGVLLYSGKLNNIAVEKYMYTVPEEVKVYFKYESTDTTPYTTPGVAINKESRILTSSTNIKVKNTEQEVPSAEPKITSAKPELKIRIAKPEVTSAKSVVTPLLEMFDIFWAAYPIKKGKPRSLAKWLKMEPSKKLFNIIIKDLAERPVKDRQWIEGYIQHPSTYLNQSVWEDEMTPPRKKLTSNATVAPKGKYNNLKSIKVNNNNKKI